MVPGSAASECTGCQGGDLSCSPPPHQTTSPLPKLSQLCPHLAESGLQSIDDNWLMQIVGFLHRLLQSEDASPCCRTLSAQLRFLAAPRLLHAMFGALVQPPVVHSSCWLGEVLAALHGIDCAPRYTFTPRQITPVPEGSVRQALATNLRAPLLQSTPAPGHACPREP